MLKVETDEASEFVLREELDELKQKHTIVSPPETIVPAGSLGSFHGPRGPRLWHSSSCWPAIARRLRAGWRCRRRRSWRINRWWATGGR